MKQRRILGPVVASSLVGLAVAAGILAGPTPAAQAAAQAAVAACPGATGVPDIVDYNEIGGPTRAGCDAGGGGESAARIFPDAGFTLEYEPRQPGYVCKVTGLPTDRACLEDDSFWSLWWSDGKSGRWVFANQGVSGLNVPDGGYVAFAWHEGAGSAQAPDVVPTAHQSTQTPSQQPSHTSDGGHTGGATTTSGGGASTSAVTTTTSAATTAAAATTTSSGAAAPTTRASKKASRSTEPTTATQTGSSTVPGAAEITAGPPGSDLATESDADDGGTLPTWVGLGLAAVVLGAAGLVVLLRRRERGGPPA
jgi:hypothetical protein